jgi:hypothetical protein
MFEPKWKSGVVKSVLETGCGENASWAFLMGSRTLVEAAAGTVCRYMLPLRKSILTAVSVHTMPMASSPTPSAIASAANILRSLSSPQKSSINTGLREQASGLRHNGRDPKLLSPAALSPNLRTSRI